ncbi:MAG TPA: thiamine pyrophosphate-dependent enzyme [Acidimicrobiales bacterium]|nr:thiamine pyrophosphate-dependent enzyme [Acidimicrobiales bacterium]
MAPEAAAAKAASPIYSSDAMADALRALGYRYLPLVPGSSFRGLHDSLVNYHGNTAPEIILCLHEEVAVSLAHGYAKATGTPCAAVVHDLVGLMHASMAVYNAFCDQVPVVVLGGGGPVDTAIRRSKDWVHSAQTQTEQVREFVKWVDEPATTEATISAIYRAHQFAASAPPGPCYVTIDMGLQEELLAENFRSPELSDYAPAPPIAPDPSVVERAIELLRGARFPLVVGGQVARDPAAAELLGALVESLGAAYQDDDNLVGLATNHPLNLTGDDNLLKEADVVLFTDVADPSVLLPEGDAKPFLIDLSLGDLRIKSWSNAFGLPIRRDLHLLADPMAGLRALAAHAATLPAEDQLRARKAAVTERAAALRDAEHAELAAHWDDSPIFGGRLIAETFAAVKDLDWFLILRNTRNWLEGVWEFTGSGQYLGHSGGGGVGYGPGAAVGGALAARDRGQFAVGIVGDGDLLMANTALWTAVHSKIPALFVVNDNRSFYNDETHQQRVARSRKRPVENAGVGIAIDEPPVDFVALARAYGCFAEETVTHPGDLAPALDAGVKAVLAGGVAVIQAITAPREG